jgi:hypothetical protein
MKPFIEKHLGAGTGARVGFFLGVAVGILGTFLGGDTGLPGQMLLLLACTTGILFGTIGSVVLSVIFSTSRVLLKLLVFRDLADDPTPSGHFDDLDG